MARQQGGRPDRPLGTRAAEAGAAKLASLGAGADVTTQPTIGVVVRLAGESEFVTSADRLQEIINRLSGQAITVPVQVQDQTGPGLAEANRNLERGESQATRVVQENAARQKAALEDLQRARERLGRQVLQGPDDLGVLARRFEEVERRITAVRGGQVPGGFPFGPRPVSDQEAVDRATREAISAARVQAFVPQVSPALQQRLAQVEAARRQIQQNTPEAFAAQQADVQAALGTTIASRERERLGRALAAQANVQDAIAERARQEQVLQAQIVAAIEQQVVTQRQLVAAKAAELAAAQQAAAAQREATLASFRAPAGTALDAARLGLGFAPATPLGALGAGQGFARATAAQESLVASAQAAGNIRANVPAAQARAGFATAADAAAAEFSRNRGDLFSAASAGPSASRFAEVGQAAKEAAANVREFVGGSQKVDPVVAERLNAIGGGMKGISASSGPAAKGISQVAETAAATAAATEETVGALEKFNRGLVTSISIVARYTLLYGVIKGVESAIGEVVGATTKENRALFELRAAARESFGTLNEFAQTAARGSGRGISDVTNSVADLSKLRNEFGLTTEQVKLVEQATLDLAAVNNKGLEPATNAVSLALRGQTRTLEGYGITLNSRAIKELANLTAEQKKNYDSLDATTLAQIRVNEFLRQTAAYHGEAAKFADSQVGAYTRLGAAIQNLAQDIGERLQPNAQGLEGVLAKAADTLKTIIDNAAGAKKALDLGGDQAELERRRRSLLGQVSPADVARSLPGLGVLALPPVAPVIALTQGVGALTERFEPLASAIRQVTGSSTELTPAVAQQLAILDHLRTTMQEAADTGHVLNEVQDQYATLVNRGADSDAELTRRLKDRIALEVQAQAALLNVASFLHEQRESPGERQLPSAFRRQFADISSQLFREQTGEVVSQLQAQKQAYADHFTDLVQQYRADEEAAKGAAQSKRDAALSEIHDEQEATRERRLKEDEDLQASVRDAANALQQRHQSVLDNLDAEAQAARDSSQQATRALEDQAEAERKRHDAATRAIDDEAQARQDSLRGQLDALQAIEQAEQRRVQAENAQEAIRNAQFQKINAQRIQDTPGVLSDPAALGRANEALRHAQRDASLQEAAAGREARRQEIQDQIQGVQRSQQARRRAEDDRNRTETDGINARKEADKESLDSHLKAIKARQDAENHAFERAKQLEQDRVAHLQATIKQARELEDAGYRERDRVVQAAYAFETKVATETARFRIGIAEAEARAYARTLDARIKSVQAAEQQILRDLHNFATKGEIAGQDIGKSVYAGLLGALAGAGLSEITDRSKDIGLRILDGMRTSLDAKSPSKATRDIGDDALAGFLGAINDGAVEVVNSGASTAQAFLEGLAGTLAASAGSAAAAAAPRYGRGLGGVGPTAPGGEAGAASGTAIAQAFSPQAAQAFSPPAGPPTVAVGKERGVAPDTTDTTPGGGPLGYGVTVPPTVSPTGRYAEWGGPHPIGWEWDYDAKEYRPPKPMVTATTAGPAGQPVVTGPAPLGPQKTTPEGTPVGPVTTAADETKKVLEGLDAEIQKSIDAAEKTLSEQWKQAWQDAPKPVQQASDETVKAANAAKKAIDDLRGSAEHLGDPLPKKAAAEGDNVPFASLQPGGVGPTGLVGDTGLTQAEVAAHTADLARYRGGIVLQQTGPLDAAGNAIEPGQKYVYGQSPQVATGPQPVAGGAAKPFPGQGLAYPALGLDPMTGLPSQPSPLSEDPIKRRRGPPAGVGADGGTWAGGTTFNAPLIGEVIVSDRDTADHLVDTLEQMVLGVEGAVEHVKSLSGRA